MQTYLYQDLYQLEDYHWWHKAKRNLCIKFIRLFSPVTHPQILDVGCGTGKNLEEFNHLGQAWGIDKSRQAIKFCHQRKLKHISLGNSQSTGLPTNTFDIITLLDVLEHTDDDKTLLEMRRILNPDGILIINVPAFSWLWSRWDQVLHHRRRYAKQDLKQKLIKNNLLPVKLSYWNSFLVLPTWFIRKVKSLLYPNYYPSDFRLINPVLNALLYNLSLLEQQLISKVSLPLGTSLFCVAKKI